MVTDGISASILFSNKQKKRLVIREDLHEENIRMRYLNDEYIRKIGVDLGYSIWLAAVIKYKNGEEDNVKLKFKQFHKLTGMKARERKRKRLTEAFEHRTAQDRKKSILIFTIISHEIIPNNNTSPIKTFQTIQYFNPRVCNIISFVN